MLLDFVRLGAFLDLKKLRKKLKQIKRKFIEFYSLIIRKKQLELKIIPSSH
jgi:hypothetical protein